jgi:CRISPR-associated protein Cst1
MQQLISQQTTNRIELTGNPFVDNGLAIIAALCKCENIEDLTLKKMKNLHGDGGDGVKLAHNNMKLKANYMVFINSITTQPSYSEIDKIEKYAKITTAILNNIGHEEVNEFCDFCGNPYSVDLTKLYHENIKVKKKKKAEKTKKRKLKPAEPEKRFVGRDLFPLVGSMRSDAQALPGASRSLNSCAKCLFSVQYLPQASILVNKLLALFQSTSTAFWYEWVTNLTAATRKQLAIKGGDKIETEGKKEGSGAAVKRLLEVMRNSKRYDPNASMIMYQYSNGKGADLKKQLIPNVALNFLHEATTEDIDDDIKQLIYQEGKTSYRYSFLNCIAEQQDYYPLYPSNKLGRDGASPELFLLYQTYILKYPAKSLHTAYKIA